MKRKIIINNLIKPYKKKIKISGDKSISIRCVLLASQAIGISKIYNLLESEDVINSLKSIKKLGINYEKFKNYYKIYGFGLEGFNKKKNITLNAGNSGTLARLILGLLVNYKFQAKLIGDKSLSNRDFSRITDPLQIFGANIKTNNGKLPVLIKGSNFLRPINYIENIGSAQCKSAVMLAALKTRGKTKIKAKKSRDHTELLFKNINIPIKISKYKYYDKIEIDGLYNYDGFEYKVPGDISSASFFIVLTLLSKSSSLTIKNVNINSSRTGIIKILNRMNAKIIFKNKKKYKGELVADIFVKSQKNIRGINCPKELNSSAIDEFLVIFLVASKANGTSYFYNLSELNKKESPRLDIALDFLKKIGIKFIRKNDDVKIYGNPELNLKGNYKISNFSKDHRIFMMSCVAGLIFGGNWTINDPDSIRTSFPDFLNIIKKLGAKVN